MAEFFTELPTKPGRYFIRPILKGPGRVRSYLVLVNDFGGSLVAWGGPDLCEYFRMADLDRVAPLLHEPGLEWCHIDDRTEWVSEDWAAYNPCVHAEGKGEGR